MKGSLLTDEDMEILRKKRAAEKQKAYRKKERISKKTKKALERLEKKSLVDMGKLNSKQELAALATKSIFWQPHPGPQTQFLSAVEDEVLFAGGRGSGKSDCLLADPLRYCGNPRFKALIIRRTMPELRDLMGRAKHLYPKAYPGVKWKEMEKTFFFPSGAKIIFGYCESMDDAMQYQGQEYCWLGVDEVTQYPDEAIIDSIIPSLRSPDETLPIFVRYSCNPGGPGRRWVKERFIDVGPANTRITLTFEDDKGKQYKKTRRWINSTVEDNPSLNDRYRSTLAAITDPVRRAQWLSGNWDLGDGTAFPEFSREHHVIEPFAIPHGWKKFRACDWGYSSLAVVHWLAVDYDNNVYIYREFCANGPHSYDRLTADKFAKEILSREHGENIRYGYLDSSVWAQRGEVGETPADTMMKMGCSWIPSDRSPGSRVARKLMLHNFLAVNEVTKQPKLKIFNTCNELIKELLNLTIDDNNPEDVDTTLADHAYDAATYGLASLPNPGINFRSFYNHQAPVIVNVTTGM